MSYQPPPAPPPQPPQPPGPPPEPQRAAAGVRPTPVPVVTYTLLAVNTAMLLLETVLSHDGAGGLLSPSTPALCQLGALNAAAIVQSGQYWRLLTVMVLHAGIIHWAFNSWALYLFGPLLERLLGRVRFLALYVGAGLVGSAASLLFTHTDLGVGASGAIFGLLGALVAFSFRRRRDPRIQALFRNLLFILIFNLYLGFRVIHVDNSAHIGGFLGGLAAMALFETIPVRPRPEARFATDPGRRRPGSGSLEARDLALAVPFLACLLLTAVAVATFPATPAFSCAGI